MAELLKSIDKKKIKKIAKDLQEIEELDETEEVKEEEELNDDYDSTDISFNYNLKPKDKCYNYKKQAIKIV